MARLILEFENSEEAKNLMPVLQQLKGVLRVRLTDADKKEERPGKKRGRKPIIKVTTMVGVVNEESKLGWPGDILGEDDLRRLVQQADDSEALTSKQLLKQADILVEQWLHTR